MAAALRAEDPGARAVPYMLSGGTDAKAFATLGIRCYGFAPLRLPPTLEFAGMFHGVDERVPLDALQFGTRVLDRFLARLLTAAAPPRFTGVCTYARGSPAFAREFGPPLGVSSCRRR